METTRDVMVCVTGQRTCARLIHEGAMIAGARGVRVHVVHVAQEGQHFMGSAQDEAQALEYLFRLSNEVGADMTVLHAKEPKEMLAQYARDHGIGCIVLGITPGKNAHAFAQALEALLGGGVDICPVMA